MFRLLLSSPKDTLPEDLANRGRAGAALVRFVAEQAGQRQNEQERQNRRFEDALHPSRIVGVARRLDEAGGENRLKGRLLEDRGTLIDEIDAHTEDRSGEKHEENQQQQAIAVQIQAEPRR
jgi:hypothetical protein